MPVVGRFISDRTTGRPRQTDCTAGESAQAMQSNRLQRGCTKPQRGSWADRRPGPFYEYVKRKTGQFDRCPRARTHDTHARDQRSPIYEQPKSKILVQRSRMGLLQQVCTLCRSPPRVYGDQTPPKQTKRATHASITRRFVPPEQANEPNDDAPHE